MLTELVRAATLSVIGETVAICRHGDEIIAFVNGKPMPYRLFSSMLMSRIFAAPEYSAARKREVGEAACALMTEMTQLGVCDLRELIDVAGPTFKLFVALEMIIENVLAKAKERSETPTDALRDLVSQIEEQYAAVAHS